MYCIYYYLNNSCQLQNTIQKIAFKLRVFKFIHIVRNKSSLFDTICDFYLKPVVVNTHRKCFADKCMQPEKPNLLPLQHCEQH